jgi:A/G-specific adenine glycosylase
MRVAGYIRIKSRGGHFSRTWLDTLIVDVVHVLCRMGLFWGETDKLPASIVGGVGEDFASRLLSWWADNANYHKFRRTRDPYRILISEIMLQKTRARQMDSIYDGFFERYPDPHSLAGAPEEEVERVVAPLGLKSRVATMKRAAELLASKGDAIGYADLLAIDGVGDYVAGATAISAWGDHEVAIDVNVERVLDRVYGPFPKSNKEAREVFMTGLYLNLSPQGQEKEFHWALIDLAHKVCKPKNQLCIQCPVLELCGYPKRPRPPQRVK